MRSSRSRGAVAWSLPVGNPVLAEGAGPAALSLLAASWGAEEPMASCSPPERPETRLFWTALRQEEGCRPRPRKVERLYPSLTADARNLFHCFQSSFEKGESRLGQCPATMPRTSAKGSAYSLNSANSRSASFGPGAVRASEFFLSPAPPLGLRGEPAPEPILSPDENPAPTPLRETHVPSVVRGFELTQEPFPELTPPPSDLLGRTLVSTPLADPLAPTLMDSTIGPTWTPIGGTVQSPVTLPISTNTLASISKSFQANSRILIRVIWSLSRMPRRAEMLPSQVYF
ncbi:Teneurin-3 [Manis pentadactyla]|nr:Teneurin-3 [Manis pentadactyla]